MGISCGIVGLPNVGKSTLFNALSAAGAEVANYPFCTVQPNLGVALVPDPRLDAVVALFVDKPAVHATVNFVDIAGLVRGASQGEGLGNQFLANIRETDAIAHVVRCFEDPNVVHVEGRIDPVSDVLTVDTELCLKDMESVGKRIDKARTALKGPAPKEEKATLAVCERVQSGLDAGTPVRAQGLSTDDLVLIHDLFLLTQKRVFYVANVAEKQLANLDGDAHVAALRAHAAKEGAPVVPICAGAEAEIATLEPADRPAFLETLGLNEPGLSAVARTAYQILDLITFFTVGENECRAWTVKRGTHAPQAAGVIHTDFERGFIKAEVVWWEDLVKLGSEAACRQHAKLAMQGKDYVVRDGDVIHFKFNVLPHFQTIVGEESNFLVPGHLVGVRSRALLCLEAQDHRARSNCDFCYCGGHSVDSGRSPLRSDICDSKTTPSGLLIQLRAPSLMLVANYEHLPIAQQSRCGRGTRSHRGHVAGRRKCAGARVTLKLELVAYLL